MSHFVGLCFGDYWEEQLEYYNEDRHVDAYVCYTKQEAINEAKEAHEDLYDRALIAIKDKDITSERFEYLNKIISKGRYFTNEQAWEAALCWGYKRDENDNLISTYNPDSKWDWYSIGGRWNGFLILKEKDANGNRITTNEATFGEIDWDYMLEHDYKPFCFLTEDGEWIEKGEMGWFGCTQNEQSTYSWTKALKDYLSTVDENCSVIVIDFHI